MLIKSKANPETNRSKTIDNTTVRIKLTTGLIALSTVIILYYLNI